MEKNEDKLILHQIAKGNKKAFDVLFNKYYQQLVRFAIGYLHNGPDAEEVVQDVMVKFWEQAPTIKIEISLLAFLYTSVRNKALNILKHEKVKQKYAEQKASEKETGRMESEAQSDLSLFKQELLLALADLPNRCREIFELAKFEGLTYEEIASYLNISAKTVENQMGLALKKLREALQPILNSVYET